MNERLAQVGKRIWRVLRWILLAIMIVILIGCAVVFADKYSTSLGFDKPLWDWLDLLIIPVMFGLSVLWANWIVQQNEQRRADRENQIEREIAFERNQEAALQNYLDKMTELLLAENLRHSQPADEVRTVARTRTLTVLRGFKSKRKSVVMQFLIEANLISSQESQPGDSEPVVSLEGADLRVTHLRDANLKGADLGGVNLKDADLSGADLSFSNLENAYLAEADLIGAALEEANLTRAFLSNANLGLANLCGATLVKSVLIRAVLRDANLTAACLKEATLEEANLIRADLSGADLTDATLPDGTKWTPDTDMNRFTDPDHPDFGQP